LYAVEKKIECAKKNKKGNTLSKELALSRQKTEEALLVADSLAILNQWMREDILCLIGPDPATRDMLFDFIMEELKKLEEIGSHHIAKVLSKLERQKKELLLFADKIDRELTATATKFNLELSVVRKMYELEAIPYEEQYRWDEDSKLRSQLRSIYYPLKQSIDKLLENIVRASSVVENLNSRLRSYFFLRKSFGQGSLDLLRFFLNHRKFMRSHHDERVDKSPAELLSGNSHPHWLEMLGFTRFSPAIA
jgi:hypothetical protein